MAVSGAAAKIHETISRRLIPRPGGGRGDLALRGVRPVVRGVDVPFLSITCHWPGLKRCESAASLFKLSLFVPGSSSPATHGYDSGPGSADSRTWLLRGSRYSSFGNNAPFKLIVKLNVAIEV